MGRFGRLMMSAACLLVAGCYGSSQVGGDAVGDADGSDSMDVPLDQGWDVDVMDTLDGADPDGDPDTDLDPDTHVEMDPDPEPDLDTDHDPSTTTPGFVVIPEPPHTKTALASRSARIGSG